MIEKFDSSKERIIQEFVPGKQITLAHIIPNPVSDLYSKMGMIDGDGAIGIFTITPSEGAIIAADVASKAGGIKIGFVDRFNGTLIITGEVASVEAPEKCWENHTNGQENCLLKLTSREL